MKTLLLVLAFVVVASSCKTSNPQYLKDYSVGIHINNSSSFNADSQRSHGETLSVGFDQSHGEAPKEITINSVLLNKENEFTAHYSGFDGGLSGNMFGNYLTIMLDSSIIESSFYSPKRFTVNYDVEAHNGNITPGMEFFWVPDIKTSRIQVTLRTDINDETVRKTAFVDDNGKFRIPSNWFKDLPTGSFVRLSMYRGRKKIVTTDSGSKVLIASQSSVHGTFMVNTQSKTNSNL